MTATEKNSIGVLDYITYYLLCIYSAVDCLTGFCSIYGLPSPGSAYKLLLILIFTISISARDNKKSLFCFYIFVIVLLAYFFNSFVNDTYSNANESVAMVMRIILCPILYIYLNETYKNNLKKLLGVFAANVASVFVNFILGVLGFGEHTYPYADVGIKGFYFDGNSFAIVVFCIFVFFLAQKELDNAKKSLFLFILFFVMAVCVGTKVSILSVFMLYLCFVWKRSKVVLRLVFAVLVPVFCFFVFYFLYSKGFLDFQIWRVKHLLKLFNNNILSVILSGRDVKLFDHLKVWNETFSLHNLLFGYGMLLELDIIELDVFDTFFSYGLLIFIPVLFFNLSVLLKSFKTVCFTLKAFNVLYFLICLTSGHIWYSTSAALYFSIINIYFINKRRYENENFLHIEYVPFKKDKRQLRNFLQKCLRCVE